jgi:hypothetical protein
MLLLAGLSEPHQSVIWLRKVLDQDPQNQTARDGMQWASTQLRQGSATGWKKEALPAEAPPVISRKLQSKNPNGGWLGDGLLAFC